VSELAVAFVGAQRMRPPRAELRLDVTLRNEDEHARWAVLPATLGAEPSRRVWSLDAFRLGELRHVFVVRATADAGWYAVLLPGAAQISLAAMPFGWWGDVPDDVTLTAETVRAIQVDGIALAQRLGVDAYSEPGAEVDASPLADRSALVASASGSPAEPMQVDWTVAESLEAHAARGRLDS
jgi:hypothetical protein